MSQNNSKYHTFENTTEYIENDDIQIYYQQWHQHTENMLKVKSFEFYILSFLSNEQAGRLKIESEYVFELMSAFIYIYIWCRMEYRRQI